LIISSVRARRLHRGPVVVDAVIGVGVLWPAPLFQPAFPGRPWTDWPIAVSFLVLAQACVVLRRSANSSGVCGRHT
jgi:hypothetical protein